MTLLVVEEHKRRQQQLNKDCDNNLFMSKSKSTTAAERYESFCSPLFRHSDDFEVVIKTTSKRGTRLSQLFRWLAFVPRLLSPVAAAHQCFNDQRSSSSRNRNRRPLKSFVVCSFPCRTSQSQQCPANCTSKLLWSPFVYFFQSPSARSLAPARPAKTDEPRKLLLLFRRFTSSVQFGLTLSLVFRTDMARRRRRFVTLSAFISD